MLLGRVSNLNKFLPLLREYLTVQYLSQTIELSVDRTSNVISTLNKFTKKKVDNVKEKLNLHASLHTVKSIFKYRISNDVEFDINIDPSHFIYGVETELYQVWSNLVKNALDAMELLDNPKHKKRLSIYIEKDDHNTLIHFENNGPEIPSSVKPKILKRYFTTKEKNGTGLGLSIVSKIVADHYGKINFISNEQKTVFTVSLPSPPGV